MTAVSDTKQWRRDYMRARRHGQPRPSRPDDSEVVRYKPGHCPNCGLRTDSGGWCGFCQAEIEGRPTPKVD